MEQEPRYPGSTVTSGSPQQEEETLSFCFSNPDLILSLKLLVPVVTSPPRRSVAIVTSLALPTPYPRAGKERGAYWFNLEGQPI